MAAPGTPDAIPPGLPPAVYAVTMPDDLPDSPPDDGYPVAVRAVAALGLFVIGGLAFILLDVLSGGKLAGCTDCTGKADAGE